jgi:predicted nucleic acid-binding protein
VAEPNGGVLYADTSALVKLVVREAESDAIEAEVSR